MVQGSVNGILWYGVACGMVWYIVLWCGMWYGVVWSVNQAQALAVNGVQGGLKIVCDASLGNVLVASLEHIGINRNQ